MVYILRQQFTEAPPTESKVVDGEPVILNESEPEVSPVRSPSVKSWNPGFEFEFDQMKNELLAQAGVVAIVYPKKIDSIRIRNDIEEIVRRQEAVGDYIPYYKRKELTGTILTEHIVDIRHQQVDARIAEIMEVRQVTGRPPMTEQETIVQRDTILEGLIDSMALGFAGMGTFAPTEKELGEQMAMTRARFKSHKDKEIDSWIIDFYGDKGYFGKWLRYKIAGDRYLAAQKRVHVQVHEDEMKGYYDEHRQFFEMSERMEVSQIFVKIPATMGVAKREEERRRLEIIANKLRGGESFDRMAQQFFLSDDHGRIVSVGRGDLPLKLEQAVFSLKKGQVSSVVASNRGLHIFKAVCYHPEQLLPFKQVRDQINNILVAKKLNQYLKVQLPLLREQLGIKRKSIPIVQDAVRKSTNST